MTNQRNDAVELSKLGEEGSAKARPSKEDGEGPRRRKPTARISTAGGEEKRRQAAALHQELDAAQVWKQFEDLVIPGLRLSVFERAIYSHLLRHSRLEGRARLRFSIKWVARGAGLSEFMVRKGVRQLVMKGALRLAERSKRGHVIEVRLPEEIRALRERDVAAGRATREANAMANLEETDFLETKERREAIHAREGGRCFYCLRRTTPVTRCLDHVIPRVRMGRDSYRNLVSSCGECNSQKGEQEAQELLRWLYREGRLGTSELRERLQALEKLAAGELRPAVEAGGEGRSGEGQQRRCRAKARRYMQTFERRERQRGEGQPRSLKKTGEGGARGALGLQGVPRRVARGDFRERQEN